MSLGAEAAVDRELGNPAEPEVLSSLKNERCRRRLTQGHRPGICQPRNQNRSQTVRDKLLTHAAACSLSWKMQTRNWVTFRGSLKLEVPDKQTRKLLTSPE